MLAMKTTLKQSLISFILFGGLFFIFPFTSFAQTGSIFFQQPDDSFSYPQTLSPSGVVQSNLGTGISGTASSSQINISVIFNGGSGTIQTLFGGYTDSSHHNLGG